MEAFYPVDVNRMYRQTLVQDQREALKTYSEALEAGYDTEYAIAIVYKAGQNKGRRNLRRYREKISALKKENSALLESMIKQNNVPENIREIMEEVNKIESEPTPGEEMED